MAKSAVLRSNPAATSRAGRGVLPSTHSAQIAVRRQTSRRALHRVAGHMLNKLYTAVWLRAIAGSRREGDDAKTHLAGRGPVVRNGLLRPRVPNRLASR